MSNNNQLFNRIDAILDGIDHQEDDPKGGWWHTEDGARLGRIKLRELKEAIQEHLITVAGTACAGAARTQPFPVDLAALHDPDFSNGLSSIEHLNRLSGVAPSKPALLPTEENMSDLADEILGIVLPEGAGARLITRALELWGQVAPNPSPFPTGKSAGRRLPVHESCPANGCSACRDYLPCARLEPLKQVAPAPVLPEPSTRDDLDNLCGPPTLKEVALTSAQMAAIAQPAEVHQLTPKEVQAQECFTALRDEILNLNDGLEVNEVLHIIDNHTPEWV